MAETHAMFAQRTLFYWMVTTLFLVETNYLQTVFANVTHIASPSHDFGTPVSANTRLSNKVETLGSPIFLPRGVWKHVCEETLAKMQNWPHRCLGGVKLGGRNTGRYGSMSQKRHAKSRCGMNM